MTYEPKVGDRVRVVIEDTVRALYRDGFELEADPDDIYYRRDGNVVFIEKILPPLPTTPGSVVKDGKEYYVMTEQGYHHVTDPLSPIAPQSRNFSRNYDIIFDAGAK